MTNRTDAATTPLRALLSAVVRAGRGIRWYMTTLMGDTAYAVSYTHLTLPTILRV